MRNPAADHSNRRSICVPLLRRSGKSLVASPSIAEYVAAVGAAKEFVWLQRLLSELHEGTQEPTTFHIDNRAPNSTNQTATKHIDVGYRFIRKSIADGSDPKAHLNQRHGCGRTH